MERPKDWILGPWNVCSSRSLVPLRLHLFCFNMKILPAFLPQGAPMRGRWEGSIPRTLPHLGLHRGEQHYFLYSVRQTATEKLINLWRFHGEGARFEFLACLGSRAFHLTKSSAPLRFQNSSRCLRHVDQQCQLGACEKCRFSGPGPG